MSVTSPTRMISARLPVDLLDYLDRAVAEGRSANRTELMVAILDAERRRADSERDAAIYRATGGGYADLEDWVSPGSDLWASLD